jgi:hypothetical protein
MQHILVYADSLAWGIVPGTRQRLAFEQRWPGFMEAGLNTAGRSVRVIGLPQQPAHRIGPFKPGRNGFGAWRNTLRTTRNGSCRWAQ